LRVELAAYRSAAYHMRFLEQVLASSPRPEVAWDRSAISESIEALSSGDALSSDALYAGAPANPRAARLIARVFSGSNDPDLRFSCLRALSRLNVEEAHNELWRLSQDPSTDDSWRAVCVLYFRGHTTTSPAGSIARLGAGQ
jgi:HEAT repeat protein